MSADSFNAVKLHAVVFLGEVTSMLHCLGSNHRLAAAMPFAMQTGRIFIDFLMGLYRGAVFQHGGVPENSPLTLNGPFPPSLMGRFLTLMGRFPECLDGPFSLSKVLWKTAH